MKNEPVTIRDTPHLNNDAPASEMDPVKADLLEQLNIFSEMAAKAEDRFQAEHSRRVEESNANAAQQLALHRQLQALHEQLEKQRAAAQREQKLRLASVPRFVLTAAAAFVLLLVPNGLQKLSIIGPQLSFAIQALLMMTMSFCYAIIWDRTRK